MPDDNRSESKKLETSCCIVGGGPAGMMLGFLLARAGIDAMILEKHKDFLRDFRGDTIHPSTFEVMYELGLLSEFLKRPHEELQEIGGQVGRFRVAIADLRHLPVHCKFVGMMPQWDFLNFLAEHGRVYPGFHALMETEVTDLIDEGGRIRGVRARTTAGDLEIRAKLTVGADGRHSIVREKAGLEVIHLGAPIDVLWMRIRRGAEDPEQTLGHVQGGKILVMIDRGDYWQCAYVIPKGGFDQIQQRGLPWFREQLTEIAPFLGARVEELKTWDDVKLLSVTVDRLRHWSRPGLLCIGDSAHAMSPVGGVGINLAIQDAVAAANILTGPLASGVLVEDRVVQRVQKRRQFPTRMTQALQVFAHKKVLTPTLNRTADLARLPLVLRLLQRFPRLRRIPARVIGLGFRPEHVHTPEVRPFQKT